jgi:hypothetical protein
LCRRLSVRQSSSFLIVEFDLEFDLIVEFDLIELPLPSFSLNLERLYFIRALMLVSRPKSSKQLDTLGPMRQKQKVWLDLSDKLRNDLDSFLASDLQASKHVFLAQINLASSVGPKKKCILLYLILAWYRGHLQVDTFCMELASDCESSFFGWVQFQVLHEQVGKDIFHMFHGVEKTINQFFRDVAKLKPDGGNWTQPWALNKKWVHFARKRRCAGFSLPVLVSTSSATAQVCVFGHRPVWCFHVFVIFMSLSCRVSRGFHNPAQTQCPHPFDPCFRAERPVEPSGLASHKPQVDDRSSRLVETSRTCLMQSAASQRAAHDQASL